MTLDQVKKRIETEGIEYFLCSFVEMSGAPKAKLVPATNFDEMSQEGAGFAGFAAGHIGQGPHDTDMMNIPDFNSWYGISYRLAKSKIAKAADAVTLDQWRKTSTTLSNYKDSLRPTLYRDMGTPEQIRLRAEFMLGVDFLNSSCFRVFPKTTFTPFCHFCGKEETLEHFLCKCKVYHEPRYHLYTTFTQVYPASRSMGTPWWRSERHFDHIGLLREPEGKENIARHRIVIRALDRYIMEAIRIRDDLIQQQEDRVQSEHDIHEYEMEFGSLFND